MSRVGKKSIAIPQGVKVEFKDGSVVVEGPKGKLSGKIDGAIKASVEDGQVLFSRKNEERQTRAVHGTLRSKINNMIIGVTKGFTRELEINGVGYKAELKGDTVHLSVGFSYPKPYKLPAGVKLEVEKGTKVKISGIDKQLVGEVASEIRKIRPPEPYKGKGIKYAEEVIKRKVGKAAVTQTT